MKIRRCVVSYHPHPSQLCAWTRPAPTWYVWAFFFSGPVLSPPCRTCASTSAGTWARWWWVCSSITCWRDGVSSSSSSSLDSSWNLPFSQKRQKPWELLSNLMPQKYFVCHFKQWVIFSSVFERNEKSSSPGVWRHQHHPGAAGRHPGLCQRKRLQGAAVFPVHTSAWEIVLYSSFNNHPCCCCSSSADLLCGVHLRRPGDHRREYQSKWMCACRLNIITSPSLLKVTNSRLFFFTEHVGFFSLPDSKWSSAAPTTLAVTRRRQWPTFWRGSTVTRWPTCRWTTTRTGLAQSAEIR